VGYTNAGKSTLFNRLTNAEVEAKDMLFATLDTTMRAVRLPHGRPAVMSDTVGFISDLPHELVEAFRATLEEVAEADVVVHVRDIAGPDSEAQAADVAKVLEEIGAGEGSGHILVEVWNKIDLVASEEREALFARASRATQARAQIVVPVSAVSGEGIDALLSTLADLVDQGEPVTAQLPANDGRALAWLYRHGRIVDRTDAEDGTVRLSVRLDLQALGQFERLFPEALTSHVAE
jgi:GTP-binding protein HflX